MADSGIAGILNMGGPTPGGAGQQGMDLMRLVQAAQTIKAQKADMARTALNTQLELMYKYGITPDENTFNKNLKNSGLQESTMKALGSIATTQGAPATPAATPTTVQPGGATTQDVTHMGKELQTNGGTTTPQGPSAIPAGTGTVEKGVTQANAAAAQAPVSAAAGAQGPAAQTSWLSQLGTLAQQRILNTATTEAMKEHLTQQVIDLKNKAMGGDMNAVGALMRVNEIPFNMNQVEWDNMTPDQRNTTISIAAGNESPAAKEARLSSQAMTLFSTGRFDSVQDARNFAEGKAGIQPKPDLQRMAEEATNVNQLVQMGFSFDQAKDIGVKRANGVSLADALPTGVQTAVQQQLANEQTRLKQGQQGLDIQKEHLGLEREELAATIQQRNVSMGLEAKKMLIEISKQNDESFNGKFNDMMEAIRNKQTVPADMYQNMVNELATRSGMIPQQINGIMDWLGYNQLKGAVTGVTPKNYKYVPDTSSDSDLLKRGIGGSQQLNQPPSTSAAPTSSSGVPPIRPGGTGGSTVLQGVTTNTADAIGQMNKYREDYKKTHGVYPEQDQ